MQRNTITYKDNHIRPDQKARAILSEIMEDIEDGEKEAAIIAKLVYFISKYAYTPPGYKVIDELVKARNTRQERRDEVLGIKPYYYIYREIAELKNMMDYAEIEKRHMEKKIGKDKLNTLEAILNDIIEAEKD